MPSTIKAIWDKDDGERGTQLDRVRLCCALSLPWLEPPVGQTESQKLPQNYQSLGSRGIVGIAGQTLTSLFPPQLPWVHLVPKPEIYSAANADPDIIGAMEQKLLAYSIQLQASFDAAGISDSDSNPVGFRTAKRQALTQVFCTGDVLEQMDDDLRLTVYRRSSYVTKRSPDTKVIYHVIKVKKDPLALADEELAKSGLDKEKLAAEPVYDRLHDLYTIVEWNPQTKKWVTRQEMNDKEINQSEEKISRFFSTYFELPPGEHMGRGLVELNLGDLRSYNALREKILDFAAMCSKMTPVYDYGWQGKPKDLAKPSGEPITGRVSGGMVQDVAFLKVDKVGDFNVVQKAAEGIRSDLGAAMLIGSETVRHSERTTAFEVQAVTVKEIDNVLGGFYAPVADGMQLPMCRKAIDILQSQNKMPNFKSMQVDVRILTGIAALARAAKVSGLLTLADVAAKLGPEVTAKLDKGVLLDVIARYANIYEPGLIKSDEKMDQERQQAIQAQAQVAANEQGD